MEIRDISFIDEELHGFITDFVFSVKTLTKAEACSLRITNNILNMSYTSGEPKGDPSLVVTTKQRTHVNCTLSLYGNVKCNPYLQLHLKSELELLRKLIKTKLQLFFREKWQETGFFFKYEQEIQEFEEEIEIFKEICENLRDYINKFIDIYLIGIFYIYEGKKIYLAGEKEQQETIRYFSKTVLAAFKNKSAGWIEKRYADYWILARKLPHQILCLLFKGEPHPIYRVALSFLINELLMLFSGVKWSQFHYEMSEELMKGFVSALEAKDVYTRGHSEGVAYYSLIIGKSLGLTSKELSRLYTAALLHDIGKVGIPDCILLKPGRLSKTEYNIIKLHSIIGAEIVGKIKRLSDFAPIIKAHHERWDGEGYPDGLRGEEIPYFSRIIAVADAYDAMLGTRIYKKAKTKREALKELERCAGSQFDPYIIKKCLPALKRASVYKATSESFIPETIEEVRRSYYYVDFLTGAKNINALFEDAKRFKKPFYIIFLDIQKFKLYNIKEGIIKGNEILTKFSQLLYDYFLTNNVYRVGGDDFVVVIEEKMSKKDVEVINKKLEEALGLGVKYEIKKVNDFKNTEKVLQELKLLSYYDYLLENQFETLSNLYSRVAIWDKKLRLIKSKGIKKEELKNIKKSRQGLKPLYHQNDLLGYVYIG